MTDRAASNHFRGRHYAAEHITGPVPSLNPTTRLFSLHKPGSRIEQTAAPPQPLPAAGAEDDNDEEKGAKPQQQQQPSPSPTSSALTPAHASGIYYIWHSRDNRKGRHALALRPPSSPGKPPPPSSSTTAGPDQATRPPPHAPPPTLTTNTPKATLRGISRMLLRYPIWDVSYDVALIFTLGSIVWVLNGFLVLLPLTNPDASWPGETAWGGGVSAVVGATIFEVGSVLLMLEAVNENRSDCFGWAVEEALGRGAEEEGRLWLLRREKSQCRHHHRDRRRLLAKTTSVDGGGGAGGGHDEADSAAEARRRRWTWWPSWHELRTHYIRDIGFLACLSQMIGATVFWISGFTGLPQVLGALTVPAENGIYWLPQVIGGTGFIISSWLFMLETQPNWHTPSPRTLGWHIGLWNLIGAVGFTLCGALGFASGSSSACETASLWSTFIGSWAFLIGSIIQWYESLDKYPVTVVDIKATGPGSSSSSKGVGEDIKDRAV